jgi:hypothetical protein
MTGTEISVCGCVRTSLVPMFLTLDVRTFSELQCFHPYLSELNRDALRGKNAEYPLGFKRMSGSRHPPGPFNEKKFHV